MTGVIFLYYVPIHYSWARSEFNWWSYRREAALAVQGVCWARRVGLRKCLRKSTSFAHVTIAFIALCYWCYGYVGDNTEFFHSFKSLNCVTTCYAWTDTTLTCVKCIWLLPTILFPMGQTTNSLEREYPCLHSFCIQSAYPDKDRQYKMHGFIANWMAEVPSCVVSNTFYTVLVTQYVNFIIVTIRNGRSMAITVLFTCDTCWAVMLRTNLKGCKC